MRLQPPPGLVERLRASDAPELHVCIGRILANNLPAWVLDGTLLDASERDRARRFRRAEDRVVYLASHAALRLVLSMYVGEAPDALVFERRDDDRPELVHPGGNRPIRFNLSHTAGLFAVAVTHRIDCGVDAEHVSGRALDDALLATVLAEREIGAVRALTGTAAAAAFLRLWTRKEAVLKATGAGLRVDPRRVACSSEDDVAWIDDPALDARLATGWRMRTWWPTSEHVVSAAVHSPRAAPRAVLLEIEPGFDAVGARA